MNNSAGNSEQQMVLCCEYAGAALSWCFVQFRAFTLRVVKGRNLQSHGINEGVHRTVKEMNK